jgi:hypothetical protein
VSSGRSDGSRGLIHCLWSNVLKSVGLQFKPARRNAERHRRTQRYGGRPAGQPAVRWRRASRAIGREVGCTPGSVWKWRVRFAINRPAGLSEAGERGARRDTGSARQTYPRPARSAAAGRLFKLTAPPLAREPRAVCLTLLLEPEDRTVEPQVLVPGHGPRFRSEGRANR